MKCFECETKTARQKRCGAYCSTKCRRNVLKRLETQEKANKKRREKALLKDFDKWRNSGYRTYRNRF